jgi:hypothetical protein
VLPHSCRERFRCEHIAAYRITGTDSECDSGVAKSGVELETADGSACQNVRTACDCSVIQYKLVLASAAFRNSISLFPPYLANPAATYLPVRQIAETQALLRAGDCSPFSSDTSLGWPRYLGFRSRSSPTRRRHLHASSSVLLYRAALHLGGGGGKLQGPRDDS